MNPTAAIDEAVAVVRALDAAVRDLSDAALLGEVDQWEALGRLVDRRRVVLAGEVETRSSKRRGEDGLAFREGAKDAPTLVARVARVPYSEASRRAALGVAVAPRRSLHGEALPSKTPHVTAALDAGLIGVAAARRIVDAIRSLKRRGDPEDVDAAEAGLTAQAQDTAPDDLADAIEAWRLYCDPDGIEPDADDRYAKRSFRIGSTRRDGMTPFSGLMPAEQTALLKAALTASRKAGPVTRVEAGGADDRPDGPLEGRWVEGDGETREKPQHDFDTIFAILTAGIEAGNGGTTTGTSAVEVVVHVNADDLEQRQGVGWTSEVLTRLAIPEVERISCEGSTRLHVTGSTGETLHFGRRRREFSPAQKKILAATWRGCAYPGCTCPPAWTHAHHIHWWQRDTGPTDLDNAVPLCSHHHHLIHAEHAPVRLERHDDGIYLLPARWTGPPDPAMRLHPRN